MKIVFTSDLPVAPEDGRIAGWQVRVHQLAEAFLDAGHEVAVLGPAPASEVRWSAVGSMAEAEALRPDLWWTAPLLLRGFPGLRGVSPLLVDCYEVPFGSFLNVAATSADPGVAGPGFAHQVAEYLWALDHADLIAVANERQRAAMAGLLALVGRLDPLAPVERQVLLVPSGVPSEPRPVQVEGPPVVLWAGGAYPWFSLAPVPDVIREVVAAEPDVTFRFVGLDGVATGSDGRHEAARVLLQRIGADRRLADHVEVRPWLPYRDRAAAYAGATVALSWHGRHLETYFSMRTRTFDLVWAGLPLVTRGGDALGDLLGERGAAALVDDEGALGQTVAELLADTDRRRKMQAAMAALVADELHPSRSARPLADLDLQHLGSRTGRWLTALQPPSPLLRRARFRAALARRTLRIPGARRGR